MTETILKMQKKVKRYLDKDRIDGVKRQRAFSAAGQSRDDGQLVARDAHINVLEVVLPRALDNDIFLHSLPFAPVYLCRDRFSVIAYTNHFLMSILV